MEDELVGVAEVAAMLGVTRTRVGQLAKTAAFPAPVVRLAAGPVWRADEIRIWAEETGRL